MLKIGLENVRPDWENELPAWRTFAQSWWTFAPRSFFAIRYPGDRSAGFWRTTGDASGFSFFLAILGGRSAHDGRTTGSWSFFFISLTSSSRFGHFFEFFCLDFRVCSQVTCTLTKLIKTHKTWGNYNNSRWKMWYMSEYFAHSSTIVFLLDETYWIETPSKTRLGCLLRRHNGCGIAVDKSMVWVTPQTVTEGRLISSRRIFKRWTWAIQILRQTQEVNLKGVFDK